MTHPSDPPETPLPPEPPAGLAGRWVGLLARRGGLVLIFAAVTTVLGFVTLARMGLSGDVIDAFPANDPQVQRFRDSLRTFAFADEIVVLVETEDGSPIDPHVPFVEAVAEAAARDPRVTDAELNPARQAARLFKWEKLPLYLTPEGVNALAERLSRDGVFRQMADNRAALDSPAGAGLEEIISRDPLGLRQVFLAHKSMRWDTPAGAASGGAVVSPDRTQLIFFVRLARTTDKPVLLKTGAGPVGIVEKARAETLSRWRAPVPLKFRYTGLPVVQQEIQEAARGGLALSALSSFALVFLLFRLLFRDGAWLLAAFAATLGAGVAWTYGLIALAYGRLNLFTFFVAAIIIGLGIDYLIHLSHRFWREHAASADPARAMERTFSSTGGSILAGAATTAAAFLSILVTSFAGLHELGVAAALGIAACAGAAFTVAPVILLRRAARGAPRRIPSLPGAERIALASARRPKVVLAAWLTVIFLAGAAAPSLRFDASPESMGLVDSPALATEREIAKIFGHRKNPLMVVVEAPDAMTLLLRLGRVETAVRSLVADGTLHSARSVSSFFPMPDDQRAALARLEELRSNGRLPDPARLRSWLSAAAEKEGIAWPESFDPYVETVGRFGGISALLTPAEIGSAGPVRHFKSPDGLKAALYVYPRDGEWTADRLDNVGRLVEASGGVSVTGIHLVLSRLKSQVVREVAAASALSLALVTGLVFIRFRRVPDTFAALLPVAAGSALLVGCLAAFGVPLNYVNIGLLPMLLGIGIDYGIFVVQGVREEDGAGPGAASVAGAVALAALTTAVGFGSLVITDFVAIHSMGLVAVIGVTAIAAAALTLLPALMAAARNRLRGKDVGKPGLPV
ncbi:MAG: MMPL family transporter [Nitrospirae bacterium]|nr:MMPL family transporter [Nitrospirota bacterium]